MMYRTVAVAPADQAVPARVALTLLLVAFAALLVPVLVAAVPPLQDYPNHLSRIWLLGGGVNLPPVSEMYRVSWDTLTNIGIDLVAVVLTRVLPYDIVGRLFVAASVLLAPIGGVALWRVLHGRYHWWQLSFGLLAWSAGVLNGFLNFEIGFGLALLAAALDPVLVRCGVAAAATGRATLAASLLLIHAFAFVFYAALLVGIALGPEFRTLRQRDALLRTGRSVLAVAAALGLPALIVMLLAPSLPGRHANTDLWSTWLDVRAGFAHVRYNPSEKLRDVFSGFWSYAYWVDWLTLAAFGLPVLASLVLRRLRVHAGLLVAVLGLLACYLVFPPRLAGTYWIDRRFAFMAPLALACALRPDLPSWPAKALAASLFAVSLVRTGFVGWVWHERQADIAAVARALGPVPPGAAVLPLEHYVRKRAGGPVGRFTVTGEPSYRHISTLVLPWRQAFMPTLFTARGKQPLRVLAPWDEIVEPDGGSMPSVHALLDPAIYKDSLYWAPYLGAWRTRFDYALVMNADMPDDNGPFTPPTGMTLLRDEGFARPGRFGSEELRRERLASVTGGDSS